MYEDSVEGCNFDPDLNTLPPPPPPPQVLHMPLETHTITTTNNLAAEENLRLSMEEFTYQQHNNNNHYPHQHHAAMEIELENDLGLNMDNPYNTNTDPNNNSHVISYEQQTNWENNIYGVHDQMQHQHQLVDGSTSAPYPPTPDLLNLFSLPRGSPSSILQNSSNTFTSNFPGTLGYLGDLPGGVDTPPGTASTVLFDPLFHLNLPPQPPLFRELLQSLPHGYSSMNGSLFGSGGDERDGNNIGRQFDNGVLEFSREMGSIGRGRGAKGTKHFATERQRRVQLNDKYKALRDLVPNPTKTDRASIVGEAIDYIKELVRTVDELKLLVEKKRGGKERIKRRKSESADGSAGDDESSNMKPLGDPLDQSYNNGSLRSSWLQRKSKDTEVDIRIIDDEVTIKLVQRKKINLLLFVSKFLDELQLDLHHVAGGHIGNSYSFLFNTKMYEGSSLYASAIAQKLIEVLDRQYYAVPPTNSY